MQEVLDQLMIHAGIAKEEVTAAQKDKKTQNGAFQKGHFIETLTLPEGNEWIDYYASSPERFPEV